MPLDPSQYDQIELSAKKDTSNRIIEAFQPEAFNMLGYPTKISSLSELWKFSDVMHETGFEGIINLFLKNLTKDEFELLKKITQLTTDLQKKNNSKIQIPRSALLWAIITLRHLQIIYGKKKINILEIGPGSGYLGCLCGMVGYRYYSMDVAQAFYIHQSNLLEEMFSSKFIDLATSNYNLKNIEPLDKYDLIHIPWWKFVSNNPEEINIDVDCIVCVDVYSEMHPMASRYLSRQSKTWLSKTDKEEKFLYIQGTGNQFKNKFHDILAELNIVDMKLAFSDKMDLPEKYAPHDMFYFLQPKINIINSLIPKKNIKNRILEGRNQIFNKTSITEKDINEYYKTVVKNSKNFNTDDEEFWNFCNGSYWKWY